MSAYLQEVSCQVGQQEVFAVPRRDKSSETLAKLLQVKVSDKQVERLCHYYGQALEAQQEQLLEQGATHCFDADRQDEVHYVMVDGAQFLFREQGWKETKLGHRGSVRLLFLRPVLNVESSHSTKFLFVIGDKN